VTPSEHTSAVYLRVSSEEQRERQNIRTQADFAQRYAELRGLTFAAEFLDDGVSGTLPLDERPGGHALLEAVRARQVRTVYVYRLDRFGRDIRVILNGIHQLEQAGCALVSMTESFETVTPAGKAMLGMLAVFAAFERDSMQARIREGYDNKAQQEAKFMGGPRAPFGYDVEGRGPEAHLVIDPAESQVVRLAFHLSVSEHYSAREIAAHLNALGTPTPAAKMAQWDYGAKGSGQWTGEQITRILHNTTYKGVRYHNKRSRSGRSLQAQGVPALVDAETWETAQQRLKDARIPRKRVGERVYWLRGLLVCGRCGKRYHGWPHSERYAYYICHGRKEVPRCRSRHLNVATWEPAMWEAALARLARSEAALEELHAAEAQAQEAWQARQAERGAVEARIQAKTEERERVRTLFRRGHITQEEAERDLAAIAAEQAQLTSRWERLKEPAPVATQHQRRQILAEVRAVLAKELTPDLRQQVLSLVIDHIDVDPEPGTDYLIHWRV
jgi:site-specific DNA recombinase